VNRIRLLTATLIAVLVAGCAGRPVPDGAAAGTAGTPAVATDVAPGPAPGLSAATPATPATPAAPAAPVDVASPASEPAKVERPKACGAGQLGDLDQTVRRFRLSTDGENMLFATEFSITNTSGTPCYLSGWFGVELYGDTTRVTCLGAPAGMPEASPSPTQPCGHMVNTTEPVAATVQRIGSKAGSVVLAPGGSTVFSMLSEGISCPRRPYRMDLLLPGRGRLEAIEPQVCAAGPISITAIGRTAR
jgi:hypothetical protein